MGAAIDKLREAAEEVALTRVYIPPHKRVVLGKVQDVDGHWRQMNTRRAFSKIMKKLSKDDLDSADPVDVVGAAHYAKEVRNEPTTMMSHDEARRYLTSNRSKLIAAENARKALQPHRRILHALRSQEYEHAHGAVATAIAIKAVGEPEDLERRERYLQVSEETGLLHDITHALGGIFSSPGVEHAEEATESVDVAASILGSEVVRNVAESATEIADMVMNMLSRYEDEDKLVKLARVYVPPHIRQTSSGTTKVDGYWRNDPNIGKDTPLPVAARKESSAVGTLGALELAKTGGFSLQKNGHEPTKGFMVSFSGSEEKLKASELSEKKIADYVERHRSKLSKPNTFFGGWLDESTSTVYLDISYNETNRQKAIQMAEENQQLAIFDVEKGEVIDTSKVVAASRKNPRLKRIFLPKNDPAEAARLLQESLDAKK